MIGNAATPQQANQMLSMPGDTDYATAGLGITQTAKEHVTGGMIRDLYNAATRTIRAETVDYWL